MRWNKIEEHLFDKYCVEGKDDELLRLMEEHDKQVTQEYIGKVVEELEKESYRIDDSATLSSRDVIDIDDAIEIVKQGCVSDDVCEWHCNEYGRYHTECHYLADNDPLEYTYCPYCGKKIKVVK